MRLSNYKILTTKEKISYIVILLFMIAFFVVAIKFSSSSLNRIEDLLQNGEKVEAEVIRVEEKENMLYAPIFRFILSDGSIKEYGNKLFYGDLFSEGDKIDYIFYSEKPNYSTPRTFVRLYGAMIVSVFACAFSLSFIVVLSLKLLGISYVNNKLYSFLLMITASLVVLILGTLINFEVKRTNSLLEKGIQTSAEFIRVDKKIRSGEKTTEFPVFGFTDADGLRREVRQNWSGSRKLKIGDFVAIIYNPEYVHIARRNSFWYIHGTSLFFGFLFIVFFISTIYNFKRLW